MSLLSASFFLFVLLYTLFNGFNNCGALVAAPIASHSIQPSTALTLAVIALLCGPFLFGTAVASTIGEGLLRHGTLTLTVLLAAILAAMGWNIFTWYIGFPSSTTHALIGGLIGAAFAGGGVNAIILPGLLKVLTSLFLAPLLGFVGGYFAISLTDALLRGTPLSINRRLKNLQVLTTLAVALGNGTNNSQSSMAIMTLSLVVLHLQPGFAVPPWVTILTALALALGGVLGGFRVVRTLGDKIYPLQPVHSFTSQSVAAVIMLTMSVLGYPLSTTQVMTTTIMGIGAAERPHSVRWETVGDIAVAWLVTIPAVGLFAILVYLLLRATLGT